MAGPVTSKATVRRLAAIDMWGTRGSTVRRRIILTEFFAAAIGLVALGLWLLVVASTLAVWVFGVWAVGAGLNYVPLAAHAVLLIRPGALDAELAGVDTGPELRRYSVIQFWIFVPLALVAIELHGMVRRRWPGDRSS